MITQKQILDHFGLDDKDAAAMDPYVDWESLGKSIEEPTRVAVCHILDGEGEIVMSEGRPATVHVEVPTEYEEELKKRSLRFIGWF